MTGLSIVEYLPISDIDLDNYRFATAHIVPLKSGKKWFSLPIVPQADSEQFYNESPNADGTISVDINLIFPVNTADVRKVFNEMRIVEKYIVRLTDKNGTKIAIGSYPYPLTFTASYQSNRGSFALRFVGKQPRLSLGYA